MFATRAAARRPRRSRRVTVALAGCLLLGVLPPSATAATGWGWAVRAGGTSGSDGAAGVDVATFADGSSIIVGDFAGTVTFGATTLTSDGPGLDVFVARLDPSGAWTWAVRAGGPGREEVYAVSALPDGSAIVAGSFRGAAAFGSTTLTTGTEPTGFVARIDPSGAWVWAAGAGSPDPSASDLLSVQAVAASSDGSAIVTGFFTGTATFVTASGTTTLTSAGPRNAFVAKVGPDGVWQWATPVSGPNVLDGSGVSVLPDGSAIVGGFFRGTASFAGLSDLTSTSLGDGFVARIAQDGTWVWATRAGGSTMSDELAILAVSTFPDGAAVVTGYLSGSVDVGDTVLVASGEYDVLVARVAQDGTWSWAARASGEPSTFGVGKDIATASDGSAFVAGYLEGAATFGATTLTSDAVQDAFVATIGPTGTWVSAIRAGGSSSDDDAEARGVAVLQDGSAVVTGFLLGSATFGATTLTAGGSYDVFVARTGSASTVIPPEGDEDEQDAEDSEDLGAADVSASSSGASPAALTTACAPTPPRVGAVVTCTVTGGDPGVEILWRAAYNPVLAEAGVLLDATGTGTFSFVVPAAAIGEGLTVELVEWVAPVSLGTVGGPVPTSVPSGGGPVPAWPFLLLLGPILASVLSAASRPVPARTGDA